LDKNKTGHNIGEKLTYYNIALFFQLSLPFASFGKSKNGSFGRKDNLWGSKSIRILPGIHF